MLKGLESLFVLDNKKETERLRKEVSKAIKAIEKSGHEGALEILQKQMNKLETRNPCELFTSCRMYTKQIMQLR